MFHVGFFIPLLTLELRPVAYWEVRHTIPHLLLFMCRIMLIVVQVPVILMRVKLVYLYNRHKNIFFILGVIIFEVLIISR